MQIIPAAPSGEGGVTDHDELSNVTSNQHHQKAHAHNGADGSGTVSHDDLLDVSADDHHNEVHALLGPDHTVSGLTIGHVPRATGPSAVSFGQLAHTDLSAVSADQHHAEDHDHDGSPTQKLAQANSHQSPDTDSGTGSLHHTLGTSSTQAAAGNHTHAGGAGPSSVAARLFLSQACI